MVPAHAAVFHKAQPVAVQEAPGAAANASSGRGLPELLLPHGGRNTLTSRPADGGATSRESSRRSSELGAPSMHVVPRQGLQRRTGESAAQAGSTSVSDDSLPPLTGSHSEGQLSEPSEEPTSFARGQGANARTGLEYGSQSLVPASLGEGGSGGPDPSGGAPLAGAGRPGGSGFQLLDSYEAAHHANWEAETQALEISDMLPAGLVGGALGETGGTTQQASLIFMLAAHAKCNALEVHKPVRPPDCVACHRIACHAGAALLMQLGCCLYYTMSAVYQFCCPPRAKLSALLGCRGTWPSVWLHVDRAGDAPDCVQGGLPVPHNMRTPCFICCRQWHWQQMQFGILSCRCLPSRSSQHLCP